MSLMKIRGIWKDLGLDYHRDQEGPSPETDSANLSKDEKAKLSAFLSQYAQEREVHKWGISLVSSRK